MTVTLDMDADVLAWLKAQPTEWQRELNNLARFFMETSLIREDEFGETAGPDPARNADRIEHDFIPR